jgi:hypothetical protein
VLFGLLEPNEIELVWDKHDASALVMWTDAVYWEANRGDFDEQEADSFDVEVPEAQWTSKARLGLG